MSSHPEENIPFSMEPKVTARKTSDLSVSSDPAKDSSGALASAVDMDDGTKPERGPRFWLCFVAIMVSAFLMSMDMTGIGTALPVIIADLHGKEFEWVGSAYAVSATAFLPLSGGLAQVFGCRPVMLVMVFLFAVGSAMCGAAPSTNFIITARTIQGVGAGGIASLTQIIIADLVPLQERGTFNGLVAIGYAFGSSSSPAIAGAFAQNGQWRWFFYMNLPICGVTAFLVLTCLDLKVPRGTFKKKLLKLDSRM
ncbi:hypothetical protein ACEPAF_2975 [Sanghuangporus sanghuang]|uniref:Iron permease n=1 Tax=Sanghuangporus baumii TaxID=108892 RepID=A0A9Q5NC42_SANBA|nr:iron permease [Sanghuangporus baumii]